MPSYTITKVSADAPRTWDSPKGGIIYYIRVWLADRERPVDIGKKRPDALTVGQVVEGDIIPNPDFDADNWKAAPQAPSNHGAGSRGYQPRDDAAIHAQFAIREATQLYIATRVHTTNPVTGVDDIDWQFIGKAARTYYTLIDKVKTPPAGV